MSAPPSLMQQAEAEAKEVSGAPRDQRVQEGLMGP